MNRLKQLRNERGYTIRQLEAKIGIGNASITRYETESRDFSTENLKKFASFFEVSIDYLLCHSSFSIYLTDENSKLCFKVNEEMFNKLKEINAVYYNSCENRCINLDIVFGFKCYNIADILNEFNRINNIDKLFENDVIKIEDLDNAYYSVEPIELNEFFIDSIKKIVNM